MSDVGKSVPGLFVDVHFADDPNRVQDLSGPDVFGVDVSHHNTITDWGAVKGAGIDFAIVRVSHGIRYDRKFREHIKDAREAGLIVGTYHYYEAADCYEHGGMPMGQARVFIDGIKMAGLVEATGVLPPALDLEQGDIAQSEILLWLSDVRSALQMCPWIYTMLGWWGQQVGNDPRFGVFPLWAADWTPPLDIPKPWSDVVMWQHTNKGRVPGIEGDVDLNRFNGSLSTLRWMAGMGDRSPVS